MADQKDSRVTTEMLEKAVAEDQDVPLKDVQILKWSASAGAADGEGFSAEMLAVNVTAIVKGLFKDFSYMAKVVPENEMRAKMLKEMGIFDKEYLVYAVILPMINKTRMEKDLKPVKVPKCFYSEVDPGILIMENLKKADFKLIKSKEYGMDEGELTLFLEALAEFHAAMYHVMTTIEGDKATFLEKYPTLWGLNEMNPAIKGMFKESQQAVTDTIAKIAKEYFGQDVHDRMVAWKLNSFDIWYNTFLKPVGKFTTIVHGDAWANNAMFMYDDDLNAVDINLLDFQCTRVTSPALDVTYAITTGTPYKRRKEHLSRWLHLYHAKFASDLKVLGHNPEKVYSFEAFRADYDELFYYGFTWAIQHTVTLLKKDENFDIKDIANIEGEDQMKALMEKTTKASLNQMKTNQAYHDRVIGLLHEAIERKLF